jgi:hypothetical protein
MASDKSSFQPRRLSLLPQGTIICVQVVKSPSQTTCSHFPAPKGVVPKIGRGRPDREGSSTKWSFCRSDPSLEPGRHRAWRGTGAGRRIRAREAPAGRMEEGRRGARCGRRSGPARGPTPPHPGSGPSQPGTRRAFRVRRFSRAGERATISRPWVGEIRQLCARHASHPAAR